VCHVDVSYLYLNYFYLFVYFSFFFCLPYVIGDIADKYWIRQMTRPNDWHTKDDRLSDRRNLSVSAAEVKYKDHHQQHRERKRNRNASNKGCCFSVTPSTSERLLYGNGRKKKDIEKNKKKNKNKQTSPLNKECKKRKKNSFDDPHSIWSVFFRLLPTQSVRTLDAWTRPRRLSVRPSSFFPLRCAPVRRWWPPSSAPVFALIFSSTETCILYRHCMQTYIGPPFGLLAYWSLSTQLSVCVCVCVYTHTDVCCFVYACASLDELSTIFSLISKLFIFSFSHLMEFKLLLQYNWTSWSYDQSYHRLQYT
jgi:hypothetical protein